jgi:hypothetical protein
MDLGLRDEKKTVDLQFLVMIVSLADNRKRQFVKLNKGQTISQNRLFPDR